MRELWVTGFMHNRVRMIVASFLIKHLLIDWREGEAWFWDTLVDADLANNVGNWQWVAGSGADASPYFRIFNPIAQGEKFDPRGVYVRRWVPELKGVPDEVIHSHGSGPCICRRTQNVSILDQSSTTPRRARKPWRPIADCSGFTSRSLTALMNAQPDARSPPWIRRSGTTPT